MTAEAETDRRARDLLEEATRLTPPSRKQTQD
ncbi:hypothetical protein [Halorhabdus rudnickae]